MPVPPQYQPIIFNSVAYQAAANTEYQYQNINNPIVNGVMPPRRFASNYERMLYLQGRQNQASCGVPAPSPAIRRA
jgi:hypothetical protein